MNIDEVISKWDSASNTDRTSYLIIKGVRQEKAHIFGELTFGLLPREIQDLIIFGITGRKLINLDRRVSESNSG